MSPGDYEVERTEILFAAIARLKARPDEILHAILRDYIKRKEAIQTRRREWVDDNATWARLSSQLIDLDGEITKLRTAEKELHDSIFQESGGIAWLYEGRRRGAAE
jgi:hypothetical protein